MPRLTPAILVSLILHAGLLALALFLLSRREDPPEIRIGSVPVTIVSEIERQAAPTPSPAEEIVEEVTPDAAESPEAEAPDPAPEPVPTPPRPQPQRPQPQPQRPSPAPAERPTRPQPRPERTTPPRRETEALNLDDLTGGGQRQPTRPTRPGRPATESGAGDAPVATGQQVALFGRQVIPHWNLTFCEMAGGDALTVRMRLTVDARGRITEGPTLISPQSGSVWRAASESALRAVRAAAPYDVPDGYQSSSVTFRFETADACR